MSVIDSIDRAHRRLAREYCLENGVQSAAFWRLGLPNQVNHDGEELRRLLAGALTDTSGRAGFSEFWVAAFLLYVHSHAAGHSFRLWEDTVIPLLAGEGAGRDGRIATLREAFAQEHPFRSALRSWLREYRREDVYRRSGTHFWFVRAVVGECALVGVSGEFTDRYLDLMFRETARADDLEATARCCFRECLQRYAVELDADDRESLGALEDCLVEAGVQLSSLTRVLRAETPPATGWTLDRLFERARQLGVIRLVGLPPVVRTAVERRLQLGMQQMTAGQLLALTRRHPALQLGVAGSTWTLQSGGPLPVAHATLSLGDGVPRRVCLVDDLGRGPATLLELRRERGDGWQREGTAIWRVASRPFQVPHPERMKTQARPVIPPDGVSNHPAAWVWAGSGGLSGCSGISGPEDGLPSGHFHLVAWPVLRNGSTPRFRLSRFRCEPGQGDRVDLLVGAPGEESRTVFSGVPQRQWVIVNRDVPAAFDRPMQVRFVRRRGESVLAEQTSELAWPCPYLMAGRFRQRPGRHTIEPDTPIVLLCRNAPVVDGGRATAVGRGTAAGPALFAVSGTQPDLRIAADGCVWHFRRVQAVRLRLHLVVPPAAAGPSASQYGFEDTGILPFFARPPRLVLELTLPETASSQPREEVLALLDSRALLAGLDHEPVPDYSLPLRGIAAESEWVWSGAHLRIEADLTVHLPSSFTSPSLQVRRLSLDDWSEDGIPGSMESVRFAVLPWDSERLSPRMPGRPGSVTLADSTGAFNPLALTEPLSRVRPAAGAFVTQPTLLTAPLPFMDMQIETRTALPLCGAWFQGAAWDARTLWSHLHDGTPCALVAVPEPHVIDVRLEIASGAGQFREVAVGHIPGPLASELTLTDLLPPDAIEREDVQHHWLEAPASRLRALCGETECGTLRIDHRATVLRLCVTARPLTPAALAPVTVRLTLFCGVRGEEAVDLLVFGPGAELIGQHSVHCRRDGEPAFTEIDREIHLQLPGPGSYRLQVRQPDGGTLEEQIVVMGAPGNSGDAPPLPLQEFMFDGFPDIPHLPSLVALYRLLGRHAVARTADREPWTNEVFRVRVHHLYETNIERASLESRLIETLHQFLEDRELADLNLQAVLPGEVPRESLAEVATAVLHLQRRTSPARRRDLQAWEAALLRAADEAGRAQEERQWCQVLGFVARRLHDGYDGKARRTGAQDELTPRFPCRREFMELAFGCVPSLSRRDAQPAESPAGIAPAKPTV